MTKFTTADFTIREPTVAERSYHRLSGWQKWRVAYRRCSTRLGWVDVVRWVSERDARSFCRNNGVKFPAPSTGMIIQQFVRRRPEPEPVSRVTDHQSRAAGEHLEDGG